MEKWFILTQEEDDDGDLCIMVWSDYQAICEVITDDDRGWDRKTADKNARLISAAPDMYEALNKVESIFKHTCTYQWEIDLLTTVKAALQKAEGKE